MGWCRISSVNFNSATATFPNMCSKEPLRKQAITHQFVKAIFSFNRLDQVEQLFWCIWHFGFRILHWKKTHHNTFSGFSGLKCGEPQDLHCKGGVTCLFWTPQPVLVDPYKGLFGEFGCNCCASFFGWKWSLYSNHANKMQYSTEDANNK